VRIIHGIYWSEADALIDYVATVRADERRRTMDDEDRRHAGLRNNYEVCRTRVETLERELREMMTWLRAIEGRG